MLHRVFVSNLQIEGQVSVSHIGYRNQVCANLFDLLTAWSKIDLYYSY